MKRMIRILAICVLMVHAPVVAHALENGLDQVGQGMARMTSGVLHTLILPNVPDQSRLARLATPPLRQLLRDTAREIEGRMTDPAVKGYLAEFARRISPDAS